MLLLLFAIPAGRNEPEGDVGHQKPGDDPEYHRHPPPCLQPPCRELGRTGGCVNLPAAESTTLVLRYAGLLGRTVTGGYAPYA